MSATVSGSPRLAKFTLGIKFGSPPSGTVVVKVKLDFPVVAKVEQAKKKWNEYYLGKQRKRQGIAGVGDTRKRFK